jgi:hypothetical protein
MCVCVSVHIYKTLFDNMEKNNDLWSTVWTYRQYPRLFVSTKMEQKYVSTLVFSMQYGTYTLSALHIKLKWTPYKHDINCFSTVCVFYLNSYTLFSTALQFCSKDSYLRLGKNGNSGTVQLTVYRFVSAAILDTWQNSLDTDLYPHSIVLSAHHWRQCDSIRDKEHSGCQHLCHSSVLTDPTQDWWCHLQKYKSPLTFVSMSPSSNTKTYETWYECNVYD